MTDSWLITGARPLGGEPANVLVTNGLIAELGPDAEKQGAQRLDADDDARAVAVGADQGAGVLAGVGEAQRFSGVKLAQLGRQGGALSAG